MNGTIAKSAIFGAAALTGLIFAGPALADGMPSKGRTAPNYSDGRACGASANVGYTTDYVFRGISQNYENGSVQGGVDFTCGQFYLGVWGSNVDQEGTHEVDVYGGFKTSTGPINWDLGFIYYAYPGTSSSSDQDYLELKVGASGDVWKGGTLGGTVYYSPEGANLFGYYDVGSIWTVEGTFSQVLPKVGIFSPTFSAVLGAANYEKDYYGYDLDYTYWNIGVTLGFLEKWSLDLRYWDTDGEGIAASGYSIADDRIVGTVKYRF